LGDRLLNGSPYAIGPLSCPVCLSILSVTLMYCGQTVGHIKMKLGMQVGLGPCKAVTGLATFSARIVIYLMLIRRAGT